VTKSAAIEDAIIAPKTSSTPIELALWFAAAALSLVVELEEALSAAKTVRVMVVVIAKEVDVEFGKSIAKKINLGNSGGGDEDQSYILCGGASRELSIVVDSELVRPLVDVRVPLVATVASMATVKVNDTLVKLSFPAEGVELKMMTGMTMMSNSGLANYPVVFAIVPCWLDNPSAFVVQERLTTVPDAAWRGFIEALHRRHRLRLG